MKINARSRSSDPVQESLRERKQKWNSEVSELISELISLKMSVNGFGDSDRGIPPSSIKNPLPAEVSSLLSEVANDYQTIIGGAGGIIQEQSAYAHNRRKSKKEIMHSNDGIVSNASWVGSRLFSRIWLLGKEDRKKRLTLINLCADLEGEIKSFELKIGSNQPIQNSFDEIIKIITNIKYPFYTNFIDLKEIHEKIKIESPVPSSESSEEGGAVENEPANEVVIPSISELQAKFEKLCDDAEARNIVVSYLISQSKLEKPVINPLIEEIRLLESKTEDLFKTLNGDIVNVKKEESLIKDIFQNISRISEIKTKLLALASLSFGEEKTSFRDFITLIKSGSALKRLWNKVLLSVNPNSEDVSRLELIKSAEQIRKHLESLSDLLESRNSSFVPMKKECRNVLLSCVQMIDKIELAVKSYMEIEGAKRFKAVTEIAGPIARRDQRDTLELKFLNSLTQSKQDLLEKVESL